MKFNPKLEACILFWMSGFSAGLTLYPILAWEPFSPIQIVFVGYGIAYTLAFLWNGLKVLRRN